MTKEEFNYIKRAVEALESPGLPDEARCKILRTMSQICDSAADDLKCKLVDKLVD